MKLTMSGKAGSRFAGKKFLILIIALPFLAASCDTGGLFDFGGGTRGVFKSSDGGQTFVAANKLEKKGDIATLSVNGLAFDPSNADVIYAGATNGMYKSEDAAQTWRYVLAGIAVAAVAVDPTSSQTIYASGIVGTNGKIIKSIDGGASWIDIYSEPSKNNTVLSLAISNSNPSTILAGLNTGELIRSTDSGRTWQASKDLASRVIDIQFGPLNVAYALTAAKGLYKSSDMGATWNSITDPLTQDNFGPLNQFAASVSAFYDFTLDTRLSGVLYLGTEQGLYRTVNDGANWSFMPLPLKNGALRVSAVTVDPTNSNSVFTSVASTLYKSINGGLTWEIEILPTSAVVRLIAINPYSTNIIYLGLRSE